MITTTQPFSHFELYFTTWLGMVIDCIFNNSLECNKNVITPLTEELNHGPC